MGGNIETDRTNPRIKALYLIFSFASPKAEREPTIRDRTVVDAATMVLFRMILKNGWPLKMEV